jgi:spore germination protein YaaH
VVSTTDDDLKQIAANSDGVVLMNYDQHQTTSDPGTHRQPGVVRRQPAPRISKSFPKKS